MCLIRQAPFPLGTQVTTRKPPHERKTDYTPRGENVKTSAYYAVSPFLGALFSMPVLGEKPASSFFFALLVMLAGTYFITKDTLGTQHSSQE
jgi:hypothetical protein